MCVCVCVCVCVCARALPCARRARASSRAASAAAPRMDWANSYFLVVKRPDPYVPRHLYGCRASDGLGTHGGGDESEVEKTRVEFCRRGVVVTSPSWRRVARREPSPRGGRKRRPPAVAARSSSSSPVVRVHGSDGGFGRWFRTVAALGSWIAANLGVWFSFSRLRCVSFSRLRCVSFSRLRCVSFSR